MDCPGKEIMQDFVDGELSQSQVKQIVKHIKSCDACKNELRDLYTLQNALNQMIDKDKCPSLDELEAYADDKCPSDIRTEIAEHVELCSRCKSYVWALQASEKELAQWQAQEELGYKEFESKELGLDAAKQVLSKLLPGKIELVDKIRQSALDFVLDIRDKAIESWPVFNQQTRLVGVLGFADSADPQTEAASIILATTLYISQAVSDGDIELSINEIEAEVKEVAAKLGAGKELQKRLIDTVPPLVLKFK